MFWSSNSLIFLVNRWRLRNFFSFHLSYSKFQNSKLLFTIPITQYSSTLVPAHFSDQISRFTLVSLSTFCLKEFLYKFSSVVVCKSSYQHFKPKKASIIRLRSDSKGAFVFSGWYWHTRIFETYTRASPGFKSLFSWSRGKNGASKYMEETSRNRRWKWQVQLWSFWLGKPSKKKTTIIVTLSLPGGRGVSQNPY